MTDEELNEIDQRAQAATFGPWGWFGTPKEPYLATKKGGRVYVMMPMRSGFNGATVAFQRPDDIPGFATDKAEKYAVKEREYRDNLDGYNEGIDHPDARFIAHAREDVPILIAEIRRLKAEIAKTIENAQNESGFAEATNRVMNRLSGIENTATKAV